MVKHTKNLNETHPEIANQWHLAKNGLSKPSDVTAGSSKKVWWKCSQGNDHEWQATVKDRANGTRCPICSNKLTVLSNSLASTHPEIANQWHPAKNGLLKPSDVTAGSSKKVWWKCLQGNDHEWQTSIEKRTSGRSCPICLNRRIVPSNSLLSTHPLLAKEFHPTKNGLLTPQSITAGSHCKVWWKCSKGNDHDWIAAVRKRANGNGCPICLNKVVVASNSLAVTHPLLAKEFHPTKNGSLTPQSITAGSHRKVWWICSKGDEHVWQAVIKARTVRGDGCPYCNRPGWTIEKIRLFVRDLLPYLDSLDPVDLYDLFQEKGLLNSNGKCKAFVQALKTGTFPKEEVEKFINNKHSLVDEFIENKEMTLNDHDDEQLGEMPEENVSYNEKELPVAQTKDVFALLESGLLTHSADEEKVDYLLKKARAKIWQHAYLNEREAEIQVAQYQGNNEYAKQVKRLFCEEYEGAKSLEIPIGYSFPTQPNLMQRYVAYLVKTKKRIGNWSGTGTGKTLSAILASRIIKAELTVICCPNNVIDNWKRQINQAYPDSLIYTKESIATVKKIAQKHQYLILNYEFFQQNTTRDKLKQLIENCGIDFIVIDEIHYSKQREAESPSKRKTIISAFLSEAARKNENICVLGMSATPVINELYEGKTLIELVTGIYHDELDTKRTVKNCVALYKKFVMHGIRYVPEYTQQLNIITESIDGTPFIAQLRGYRTYIQLEGILTQIKIPYILEQLRPKTIVYTHFREGIEEILHETIKKRGWRVGMFNGDNKKGLDEFIDGDVDILIATSCVGTGVDGLQNVCNRLIINCLPWTHAEFKQLIGRIHRQGQKSAQVDVIIPFVFVEIDGQRRSRCEYRWECIKRKKTFADAAVDGSIPEGHLKTPEQVHKEFMMWLQQLEQGDINQIERQNIVLSLVGDTQRNSIRRISDFSQMNARINAELSDETHKRFLKNPCEWQEYHNAYKEVRKEWSVKPYEEAIAWLTKCPHWVVGDFGCGEAFLAKILKNTIHSFDHIAIDERVVACDMSQVPLPEKTLDAAIFSLSLMGSNYVDYIREAYRCLNLYGHLWIAEPTARISNIELLRELLFRLGFDVVSIEDKWKFTFVRAIKSDRDINELALAELLEIQILS